MVYQIEKFQGYEIYSTEITTSTNDDAQLEIDNNNFQSERKVFTTKIQTAGTGRSGRQWQSEEGNLFFSLIIKLSNDVKAELFTYVAAIAIQQMLADEFELGAKIKWPNDIIMSDKKLAGILLKKYKDMLIIGVGINVVSNPEILDKIKATCLKDFDIDVGAEGLLKLFLKKFSIYNENFQKHGFERIRAEVLQNIYKLHEKISFKHDNKIISGVFKGINFDGRVVLDIMGEECYFSSGEIFDI